MEWLLFVFYLALFIRILRMRFFTSALTFRSLLAVLLLKIIAGYSLAWLYSNYYNGGDTFDYMHDANVFYKAAGISWPDYFRLITGIGDQSSLQAYYDELKINLTAGYGQPFNNALIFVRIMAFFCLFSFGYYHVQMLVFIFLSLAGTVALYKVVHDRRPIHYPLFAALFLIPSIVFWGSGLLKEPFIIFLAGIIIYIVSAPGVMRLLPAAVALILTALLFVLKPYVVMALIPGLAAVFLTKHKHAGGSPFAVILFYAAAIIMASIVHFVYPPGDVFRSLHNQQIIFMKNAVYYQAGSLMELIPFAPEPWSVLKRSPQALWTALYHPSFAEAKKSIEVLAAAENILIIAFLIFLVFRIRGKKPAAIALTLICSGLIMLAITAFTTPVAGALVRLKVPGLLLMLAGVASLADPAGKTHKEN